MENLNAATYYLEQVERYPVSKGSVFYHAYATKIMAGNPFAIFLELIGRPEGKKYKHYWVYGSDEVLEYDTFRRYADYENVFFVKANSEEYYRAIATCEYLISNAALPKYWFKREGQIYINTWHGTPLKMLGRDARDSKKSSIRNAQRNFILADYLVMPNRFTFERLLNSYDIDGLIQGKVIDAGYPRIDLVTNTNQERIRGLLSAKINKDLDGKKILLYAPTFRSENGNSVNTYEDVVRYVQEMISTIPDEYELFFKAHNKMGEFFKDDEKIRERLIFDEIETNEMLSVTDVMITDYSSIFFDYLCLRRPCLFFIYDEKQYCSERGLYLETSDLPGALCYCVEDIVGNLKDISSGKYDYEAKFREFERQFSYNDDGMASKRIVDIIFEHRTEEYEQYFCDLTPRKPIYMINCKNVNKPMDAMFLYGVLGEIHTEGYKPLLLSGEWNEYAEKCREILPDLSVYTTITHYEQTLKEQEQGILNTEREWKKYFGDIVPDKYLDVRLDKGKSGNFTELIDSCPETKKYAILNHKQIRKELNVDRYEKLLLVVDDKDSLEYDEYRDRDNVEITDYKDFRRNRAHMNVLFLSSYDSINYVYLEVINELKLRGHNCIVVSDIEDDVNNRMFINRGIAVNKIEDFDLRMLDIIDLAVAPPVINKNYKTILNRIRNRNIFLFSFASLFSSVAMRSNPDLICCIGEEKVKEFKDNALVYNCVITGSPQYDELIRKRKRTVSDRSLIHKVMIVDQGGYPFGNEGKEQTARFILDIANNNPNIRFDIRPRYEKGIETHMLHQVSHHIQDYFDAGQMPENLRFVSNKNTLEEEVQNYDAMITFWSTAYLDAVLYNIPLLLVKGFDSIDVFDVRNSRISDAYEHLEKTGVLYDYREIDPGNLAFDYVDPEYISHEVFDAKMPAAPRVVDLMEFITKYFVTKNIRPVEPYTYNSVREFTDNVQKLKCMNVSEEQYKYIRLKRYILNNMIQKSVYDNRCVGSVLDLSELDSMFYAPVPETPYKEGRLEYAKKLKADYKSKFNEIRRQFFESEEKQEMIREDFFLQDYWFKSLYWANNHSKFLSINKDDVLAKGSWYYYNARFELDSGNKAKAFESLNHYLAEVNEVSIPLIRLHKRVDIYSGPFRDDKEDRKTLCQLLKRNHYGSLVDRIFKDEEIASSLTLTKLYFDYCIETGNRKRAQEIIELNNESFKSKQISMKRKIERALLQRHVKKQETGSNA